MKLSFCLLSAALAATARAATDVVKATIIADEVIVNEVETPITFQLHNLDFEPILIAAFGGSFTDPATNNTYNLTTVKIDPPVNVDGNAGYAEIVQNLKVDLGPADYLVNFVLYGQHGQEFVALNVEPRPFTVKDKEISSWDLKLIFSEVVLAGTFGLIGYLLSSWYLLPWLESKLPRPSTETEEKPSKAVKTTKTKKSKEKESSPTGSGYDESWIPEHHLKKRKEKK